MIPGYELADFDPAMIGKLVTVTKSIRGEAGIPVYGQRAGTGSRTSIRSSGQKVSCCKR